MRLWLLYNNSSKTPFFLDPMKAARITTTVNHDTVEMVADTLEIVGGIAHVERQTQIVKVSDTLNFEPTPPFEIFASIDNQKTVATILQAIGGVAEAVGQKPTTITNTETGEKWQVNDTEEKRKEVINETNAQVATTSVAYNLYKHSIVVGILKRNTVFPNQSVTGYIYFKPPKVAEYRNFRYYTEDLDLNNCVLHLEVFTQNGKMDFDFKPVAGE